jgi:dihydroneopterin aldolase
MRYEDASYLVKRILRDDLFRLVEHVCNEVMKQNKANEDILDSPQSQLKLFQKARLRDWQVEVQYQY